MKNYKTDAGAARPHEDRKPLASPRTVGPNEREQLDVLAKKILDGATIPPGEFASGRLAMALLSLRGGDLDRLVRLDPRDAARQYLDARAIEANRGARTTSATKIAEPDDEAKALAEYKRRAANAWRNTKGDE
jgi:hypothetical protein